MSNKSISNLKTTLGMAVVTSSLAAPLAIADTNPFAATDLGTGYQLAEKQAEGKCGEGKCGEDKADKPRSGDNQ